MVYERRICSDYTGRVLGRGSANQLSPILKVEVLSPVCFIPTLPFILFVFPERFKP